MISQYGLSDIITLNGNCPNNEILKQMRSHDIFLCTSDRREGWGAVANEAMANGCVLVASNQIGSVPYLVEDGVNGLMFKSEDVNSIVERLELLFENPDKMETLRQNALSTMKRNWSPAAAANRFIELISNLTSQQGSFIIGGPCELI